jgi:hypothetical protein
MKNGILAALLLSLLATTSAYCRESRDHRGSNGSPQGGVTVTPTHPHPGYGGGGGGRRTAPTKVTQPPPSSGPGWHGKVRCHSASCFGTVRGYDANFEFEHGRVSH